MIMANNNENKILNVPHLRFPEFTGEWKKCVLQDVVAFSNGKAHENCVNENGDYVLFLANQKTAYDKLRTLVFSNPQ